MRRFSAFLMIAALVAVLVPSAALAAKPQPGVANLMVYSYGADLWEYPVDPNICYVWARVVVDGRAYDAEFTQYKGGVLDDTLTALVDNKVHLAYQFFHNVELGSSEYTWKVQLRDRKGNPISALVPTGPDTVTESGCGTSQTIVAKS